MLWMLAYDLPADATDEYVKIGQSMAIESLKRFCCAIVEIFVERYLRTPTANNVKIGQSMEIESTKRFYRAIVEIFVERYLRTPTANDVARLLYIG